MDFTKLVMHEVDTKYQEMANGTTEEPFVKTPTVNPNHVYAQKRDDYYNRLKCENAEFNKAANQIIRTRNERLRTEEARRKDKERKRAEQRDVRQRCTKILLITVIIGAVVAAALFGLYCALKWMATQPEETTNGICVPIAFVIAIILLIIRRIVSGEGGWGFFLLMYIVTAVLLLLIVQGSRAIFNG